MENFNSYVTVEEAKTKVQMVFVGSVERRNWLKPSSSQQETETELRAVAHLCFNIRSGDTPPPPPIFIFSVLLTSI